MGINFVEADSERVINNLVTQFETALGETLQPSDERKIFLNNLAQVVIALKSNINEAGNNVLLRYSKGEALDAIGEMFGVTRIPAEYAKCVLEFKLSKVQDIDITIPQGTRATPDGKIYFATDLPLVIKAGETTGSVNATATATGSSHNGFTVNSVKYIVDNVQYLAEVHNTEPTTGGTDIENDDSLRDRIRLAPESFSTAGCEEGYIYWAKAASNDVGDVVVYSPVNDATLTAEQRSAGAGKVYIYILKKDGSIPDQTDAVLQRVFESVSASDKRPLTDQVIVSPPAAVTYAIDFNYYIAEENAMDAEDIKLAVNTAVDNYIKWQCEKIGRDINPDKLRQLVLNAGAARVVLASPAFTTISASQVAELSTKTVTYAGISE